MPKKIYNFTFASAATGTNKQFVGVANSVLLVVSGMTGWNAGTGNANITIRGGLSETDTHADILPSMVIQTHTIKGVYVMPWQAAPWMSVGFGTAVTGSASNSVDVIVYSDDL